MSRAPVGRPMEILLIEDDLLQSRLVMEAVRRGEFGHRISLIRDGQEALDFIFKRGGLSLRAVSRPDSARLASAFDRWVGRIVAN